MPMESSLSPAGGLIKNDFMGIILQLDIPSTISEQAPKDLLSRLRYLDSRYVQVE